MLVMLCAAPSTNVSKSSSMIAEEFFAPSIVMLDDLIMTIQSGNPSDTISEVKIFDDGTLVRTIAGCGSSSCNYDLSNMTLGDYSVEVTLNTGGKFNGTITLE